MPSKNSIKQYVENSVYHVYNRGVEKRDIFLDDRDYKYFLHLLKGYLSPEEDIHLPWKGETLPRDRGKPNYREEIELLGYCLMPNHFHLLIKQVNKDSMSKFMKSLCTNYAMYFNRRYNRVGTLFQGPYKAVLVSRDDYLVHLIRYIHLNPLKKKHMTGSLPSKESESWRWSSHEDYLEKRESDWLTKDFIQEYFRVPGKDKDRKNYQYFMNSVQADPATFIKSVIIEG